MNRTIVGLKYLNQTSCKDVVPRFESNYSRIEIVQEMISAKQRGVFESNYSRIEMKST
ncbi:protein of unknown function [Candidatus Nitrosocaldus cavascurensis]|uniref:Uncharacterized protein n=1 Tax=Candidatus Nitrosocaldus cavascurensis TaxID=2058097 RepID=A0A2K5ATI3_9ARCH|nr:protein of unknown function [Candidatus Nitrosocaldus cavascurensis]